MYKKIGVLLTGISGACFGFLPIFASLAYRNGGNGVTLIFIRFFTAMVLLWMIVLFKGKPYKLGKVKIFQFLILGALGYITSTAGYFSALNYISAPLVSLLFYTNPIIVSIISYFLLKEELNINKVIALILSSLGLASIVGFSIGSIDIRGVFLILAAFVFRLYYRKWQVSCRCRSDSCNYICCYCMCCFHLGIWSNNQFFCKNKLIYNFIWHTYGYFFYSYSYLVSV